MSDERWRERVKGPMVFPAADVEEVRLEGDGARLCRLITHANAGADFLLGTCRLGSGQMMTFALDESSGLGSVPPQEGYLVLEGELCVGCDDETEVAVGSGDAIYFAPGDHYIVRCTSSSEALIAYVVVPPPR